MNTDDNDTNDNSEPKKSMFTLTDEMVARKLKEHHDKKKAEEQADDSNS